MEHTSIKRIARLRNYMMEKGYDYFIIYTSDPHLSEYISETDKIREYLTGFTGSAGTLVVSLIGAYLWVDGRYFIQADNQLAGSDISIMKYGNEGVPSTNDFLRENCKKGDKIALDYNTISAFEFETFMNLLDNSVCLINDCSFYDRVWSDKPLRCFNEIRNSNDENKDLSISEKINNIRSLLGKKTNTESYTYIISDLTSIMWTTNLRGNDIKYVPVAFSYLIIEKDISYLFINSSAISKSIEALLLDNNVCCKPYEQFYDHISKYENINCYVDFKKSTYRIVDVLKKNNNVSKINESLLIRKDLKNEYEIEQIKKAHILDAVSIIHYIYILKKMAKENSLPNEYEAACILDNLRLSNGGCYELSFETISAYGENAALPHYSATKDNCSILETKGFYLVDSGGQYNHCTTDITRTISLGELSEYQKKCFTAVLKGNLDLSNSLFIKGCRGENLDILARNYLWKLYLDYKHGTGHGIGCELSVHEGPLGIRYRIPNNNLQPQLEAGMVVSDEPGFYLEGEFGIRLENELLVVHKKKNAFGEFLGFECLTLVPFEREAIIVEDLNKDQLITLNAYHKMIYQKLNKYFEGDELKWFKEITLPL